MELDLKRLKKELLRPDRELIIGDGILEVNKFTKEYVLYEIEEFVNYVDMTEDKTISNPLKDYFYGRVVAASDKSQIGRSTGCDVGAHTNHNGTHCTYFLPTYRVLYGKV